MAEGPGEIYGEALFEAAEAADRLGRVQADLNDLGRELAESDELVRVLFNPAFPEAAKRQILAKVTAGADPLVQNGVQVLLEHGRLAALPEMIAAFGERYGEAERQLEVELTTAIPIDDAQASALEARLTQATGRGVQLTRRVDPAILGGVVLRVRDLLIDASVRGRLDALRLSLRRARLAASPAAGGEEAA